MNLKWKEFKPVPTKIEILEAFKRIGQELAVENLTGHILLTGGAAMCLVHSARDMTQDVDALYIPKTDVRRIAAKIAETNQWPDDWLNDAVKGFFKSEPPHDHYMSLPGLEIYSVSPEYLLAMKLISARQGTQDVEDIKFLIKKLDLKTVDDTLAIAEKFFGENDVLPKTEYTVRSIFDQLTSWE